jgi:hypothetical protein
MIVPERDAPLTAWTGRDTLAAAAITLLLGPQLLRSAVVMSMMPGWDFDPLLSNDAWTGLGPAGSLACDALTLLGATLGLLVARGAAGPWPVLAAAIPGLAILWHAWLADGPSLGDQRIGMSWLSAALSAVALWRLGADRRYRAIAVAVLLGVSALWALQAIVQVFIEHPATVANFNKNKDLILAAQGWPADSPMARAYERRLVQSDATGWLGLSNVFGSLSAGLFIALSLTALGAWTQRRRSLAFGVGFIALLAGAALGLAQSKGASTAAALGLVAAGAMYARPRRLAWVLRPSLLGPACVFSAIGAIVARGLLGDRLGELSLYFRWFYITAAAKIGLANSLLGTGPEGFKDAFLLFKNPLCPEEVASPHSVLFDWWATMGVAALPWAVLLLAALAVAGRRAVEPADPPLEQDSQPDSLRPLIRSAIVAPVMVTLAAVYLNRAALPPGEAIVRGLGLVLWAIASGTLVLALLRADQRAVRVGLAAGAFALAAHAQIEVTMSWSASVGLVAALLALAAAPRWPESAASSSLSRSAALLITLAASGLGGVNALQAWRWESALLDASEAVRPIAGLNERARRLPGMTTQQRRTEAEQTAAELSVLLERPVPPEPAALEAASREVERLCLQKAHALLAEAAERYPRDFPTARELSRMSLQSAQAAFAERNAALTLVHADAALAEASAPRASVSQRLWVASVHEARLKLGVGREELEAAYDATRAGWALDPTNAAHGWRTVLLAQRLADQGMPGISAELPTLARRTLDLDAFAKLDAAVRALSEFQRAHLERLSRLAPAGGEPGAAGGPSSGEP